jgi:hypothetical protein
MMVKIMIVNGTKYQMVYWKVAETAVIMVDEKAENWVYSTVVLMVVMKDDWMGVLMVVMMVALKVSIVAETMAALRVEMRVEMMVLSLA